MKQSLLPALLWSWLMAASFVVSAWITQYAPPLAVTFLRFVLALFIMTPFYWQSAKARGERLFKQPSDAARTMLISGCLVGFFLCLFTALTTTSSLNTSVLYTLVPLIGAIVGLGFRLHTSVSQWISYVMGSAGAVAVLLLNQSMPIQWHRGDAIYMGGCVLLAIHIVAAQCWCKYYNPFGAAYRILLCGTLWLLPVTFLSGDLWLINWQHSAFWAMLVFLTVGATLFTFVLQQHVVATGGASRLLAISYSIPVWVSCYGVFLDSAHSLYLPGFVFGIVLIAGAQYLIESSTESEQET